MIIPNGKRIEPNGKKYLISHCAISHWEDYKIEKSFVFINENEIMKQLEINQCEI